MLADPGAIKATVALHSHPAAAQQIGHCRDCFLGVFGAGTDREDEVTEGKNRTSLEDLVILFHIELPIG